MGAGKPDREALLEAVERVRDDVMAGIPEAEASGTGGVRTTTP